MFCDPSTDMCFNMSTAFKSYTAAEAECEAMAGRLVMHTSAAKQMMVEQVRGGGVAAMVAAQC
jgi:hypothetical protein